MKKSYICIAGGITGLIATVITAIYTAKKEANEEQETGDEDEDERILTKVAKKIFRYKFVIILAILTSITFACSVHHYVYQTGCAITAYKILRSQYDDYISTAKDVLGKKNEDAILTASIEKSMPPKPVKIISTSDGTTLLYEPVSRTHYEGSIGRVQDVQKKINERFEDPDDEKLFFSYREFLDMLGLRTVHLDDQNTELNIGFYKYDGPVTIGYNVQVLPDGSRCVVLTYNLVPRYDFDW